MDSCVEPSAQDQSFWTKFSSPARPSAIISGESINWPPSSTAAVAQWLKFIVP